MAVRLGSPFLLGLLLASAFGCGPSNPGPSAELASLFQFAAYPGSTMVADNTYPQSSGPFQFPARYGVREYQVSDPPQTLQRHYRDLAARHQWIYTEGALPSDPTQGGLLASLNRDRYSLSISLGGRGAPYGPGPYGAPKPTPSPEPGASPLAAPSWPPGPYVIRIEAQSRD